MCDFLINRLRMRKICQGQMWKEEHCVQFYKWMKNMPKFNEYVKQLKEKYSVHDTDTSKMTKEELRRFQATM